jgi:hypothetical protein
MEIFMKRILATAAAFSALLGTTGLALAQNASYPGYSNGGYYPAPGQTAQAPTEAPAAGATWASPTVSTDAHTGGGGDRAYRGGQKTN